MKRLRGALILGLLLVLSVGVGCPRPVPVEAQPTGILLPIDDARAIRVLAGHRDRVARSSALRGSARVVLEGPDFKLNRPQRIAVARPGKLRFEVLGLFDVLVAMLVTDGRTYGFYDASTGEITRGPMTPELLWELANLDLETDEVVDLLLAAPVPSESLALAGAWLEPDAGLTVAFASPQAGARFECEERAWATGSVAGGRFCAAVPEDLAQGGEIFRFDSEGLLREMRSVDAGWETRVRASFEEYETLELGAVDWVERFPMRITIRSPRVGSMARFEWKRVLLAEELPDQLFTIADATAGGG